MTLSRTFFEVDDSMYIVHQIRRALALQIRAIRKADHALIARGYIDAATQWKADTSREIKGMRDLLQFTETLTGYAITSKTRAAARKAGRHVN